MPRPGDHFRLAQRREFSGRPTASGPAALRPASRAGDATAHRLLSKNQEPESGARLVDPAIQDPLDPLPLIAGRHEDDGLTRIIFSPIWVKTRRGCWFLSVFRLCVTVVLSTP